MISSLPIKTNHATTDTNVSFLVNLINIFVVVTLVHLKRIYDFLEVKRILYKGSD